MRLSAVKDALEALKVILEIVRKLDKFVKCSEGENFIPGARRDPVRGGVGHLPGLTRSAGQQEAPLVLQTSSTQSPHAHAQAVTCYALSAREQRHHSTERQRAATPQH